MPPDSILNAISGIAGVVVGAISVLILVRKMPSEIGQTESTTMRNLVETMGMLSDDNKELHEKIEELNRIIHGEYQIVTHVIFANPPRVVSTEIRNIQPVPPIPAPDQA